MVSAILAAAGAVLLLGASDAGAATAANAPPGKGVFFGVTDTGEEGGFRSFERAIGKHPPVIETYHPYGNSLNQAIPRWRALRARPILHISTAAGADRHELITPKEIARGRGDNYLLRLNRRFAQARFPAYIRPLGEPNRCLNPYTAVRCDGSTNGADHRTKWYRLAFRRMYLLLHGGRRRGAMNRKLRRLGMPPLRRRGGREPRRLPKAPVSVIWSPLPGGAPATGANAPAKYFPGFRYVDWVATDIYSRYTDFGALRRFYRAYARRKPFAITEFGVWGEDDPAFVRRLVRWVRTHRKTKMLVYYQDFGGSNPFRIQGHPRSESALKRALRSRRFPPMAPRAPRPLAR